VGGQSPQTETLCPVCSREVEGSCWKGQTNVGSNPGTLSLTSLADRMGKSAEALAGGGDGKSGHGSGAVTERRDVSA